MSSSNSDNQGEVSGGSRDDFWKLAKKFNIAEQPVLDPEKIPDRAPGSPPEGMKEWPDEKELLKMKYVASKTIKSWYNTPCETAAREYYKCIIFGMEQHNANVSRDCLDLKLEHTFCAEDWYKAVRKDHKNKATEKLGEENVEEIVGIVESTLNNSMSEEAAKTKADYAEHQKKTREEYEKRKARRQQTGESRMASDKETPSKSWWRFGF